MGTHTHTHIDLLDKSNFKKPGYAPGLKTKISAHNSTDRVSYQITHLHQLYDDNLQSPATISLIA